MNAIQRWLDRFSYKHPRFGIPNLMLVIVVGNLLVYLLDNFSRGTSFSALLTFAPAAIFQGQIWRLVTFVFVPTGGSLFFTALSLYFYYFIGSAMEREWGTAKFNLFYATGVLLNIIVGFVLYFFLQGSVPPDYRIQLVTASMTYINLSMFFSFATLYPNMQLLLFFIIPVKVKWLAWFNAAIFAWSVLSNLFGIFTYGPIALVDALLPLLALLNYVIFFWADFMTLLGRARHRTSKQTVNFKQATKKAQQQKGYLHKCAVCGKTDTENPNMEFRYCSKCNGYYCYCMEHITNHVHIE